MWGGGGLGKVPLRNGQKFGVRRLYSLGFAKRFTHKTGDSHTIGGQVTSEPGSVELTGVTKRFGSLVAVDALNLTVQPGEFLSLLGPSGCGKTTTLRMLAGFEAPDEGRIRINGQEVQDTPPYKRNVNTVFQHYALFPHMTVAENVAYGLRQRKESKSAISTKVAEALDMVKMTSMANRKPRQLSGGQQQRVALARALVNRPSVLLLDEPLGALDRKLREEMQIELKLLQLKLGITFIFVTHDQEEAMSMSDRIAVMLDGHIEQLADPNTIYEQPASAFVAGFIGRNNFWKGTATADGVSVPTGSFHAAVSVGQVTAGADALLSVRPECVTVGASQPTADNSVAGVVAGISHLGDVLQYVVRTADRDVLALVPRIDAPRLAPGDTAWCSWAARDTYRFTAEQADLVFADPAAPQDDEEE